MNHRIGAEALPNAAVVAGDPASSAEVAGRAWRFDGFEFDVRRRELRDPAGAVVPLRPKAETLLCRFLAQPGRPIRPIFRQSRRYRSRQYGAGSHDPSGSWRWSLP
jgi:hypothetical protein